ncbi:MAG: damage-inducible protein CinA [Gammaproteobacteria bacterium SG8_47]|nr:MAG: damage-inducible protein CinA [Gammaproteobacteria bacterium SG8_47]
MPETPPTDGELVTLAERVGAALRDAGWCVAIAESCTGGWIAKCLTDVAGSSGWLECGLVTYSNRSKRALLGVEEQTLRRHGAVSEQAAAQMARGVLAASAADASVAVTGIAGPSGGSPEKPVGTVWLAWARREGNVLTASHHFAGDRDAVRRHSVGAALRGLLTLIADGR